MFLDARMRRLCSLTQIVKPKYDSLIVFSTTVSKIKLQINTSWRKCLAAIGCCRCSRGCSPLCGHSFLPWDTPVFQSLFSLLTPNLANFCLVGCCNLCPCHRACLCVLASKGGAHFAQSARTHKTGLCIFFFLDFCFPPFAEVNGKTATKSTHWFTTDSSRRMFLNQEQKETCYKFSE